MNDQSPNRVQGIAATMAETESMWLHICNNVDDHRVDMLMHAMTEQHALVMEGETNADAVMALVGFLTQQVVALHEGGDMSMEAAMVLMQIGMQRGVQAHVAAKAKKNSS